MKKIECIIRGEKLETAVESLRIAGVPGITISRVEGFGTQREVSAEPALKPKAKIEIFCEDDQVDTFVKSLIIAGRGGRMGDGKIAVTDVETLVRIRTGEQNREALY